MTKREIRRLETIIRRVAHLRNHTHDMIVRGNFDHIGNLLTSLRREVETRKPPE